MADSSLRDAFIDELRDTYDAERQILKALPKMVKKATNKDLKAAFAGHLEETKGQVERLEKAFGVIDQKVKGKHCSGMAGIIEEGKADRVGSVPRRNESGEAAGAIAQAGEQCGQEADGPGRHGHQQAVDGSGSGLRTGPPIKTPTEHI